MHHITLLRPDSIAKRRDETSYTTPAQFVVDADVSEVEITTEHDLPVKVLFQAGASVRERASHVWGRRLFLGRSPEGDLRPEARAMQIVPAK